MGATFVVNAPFSFTGAWSVVKHFLDERTRAKITILGTSFLKELLVHVDIAASLNSLEVNVLVKVKVDALSQMLVLGRCMNSSNHSVLFQREKLLSLYITICLKNKQALL